jgi:hypothetical protein
MTKSMAMVMGAEGKGMSMHTVLNAANPSELLSKLLANMKAMKGGMPAGTKLEAESKNTVEGVEVTELKFDFSGIDETVKETFSRMYPEGVKIQYAAMNNGVHMGMNTSTNIVAKVNSGSPLVNESSIKSAMAALPEKAHIVAFFDLGGFVKMVQAMGAPLPIPAPEGSLEPIGVSVAGSDIGPTLRIHVPSATIKSFVPGGGQ